MSEPGEHAEDTPDAQRILSHAAARGLGRRPLLRELLALAWSAMLGASLSLCVLLLMPDDWLEAPLGFERLAGVFVALWLLALVPALSQLLLSRPPPRTRDER